MDRAGLVTAGETGPRDRRPYSLTESGRAAFREWLERDPGPEQIRYPLLLTIAFGRHLPPERLAAFIASHRQVHASRLEEYQALRADAGDALEPFAAATLDFGIRYEQAVLEWFAGLPGLLPLDED